MRVAPSAAVSHSCPPAWRWWSVRFWAPARDDRLHRRWSFLAPSAHWWPHCAVMTTVGAEVSRLLLLLLVLGSSRRWIPVAVRGRPHRLLTTPPRRWLLPPTPAASAVSFTMVVWRRRTAALRITPAPPRSLPGVAAFAIPTSTRVPSRCVLEGFCLGWRCVVGSVRVRADASGSECCQRREKTRRIRDVEHGWCCAGARLGHKGCSFCGLGSLGSTAARGRRARLLCAKPTTAQRNCGAHTGKSGSPACGSPNASIRRLHGRGGGRCICARRPNAPRSQRRGGRLTTLTRTVLGSSTVTPSRRHRSSM